MSLVPDYGESSDSSDNQTSDSDEKSEAEPHNDAVDEELPQRLPPPDFMVKSIPNQNGLQTNSVFKNPFLEAETEKEAVLQKHVKMVDLKNTFVINGKKICWNYRKGRCRFGHNCKFAHDSDIQKTPEQIEAERTMIQTKGVVAFKKQSSNISENDVKDEKVSTSNCKRKRPGLTQGLIPSKKVLVNYVNQKK